MPSKGPILDVARRLAKAVLQVQSAAGPGASVGSSRSSSDVTVGLPRNIPPLLRADGHNSSPPDVTLSYLDGYLAPETALMDEAGGTPHPMPSPAPPAFPNTIANATFDDGDGGSGVASATLPTSAAAAAVTALDPRRLDVLKGDEMTRHVVSGAVTPEQVCIPEGREEEEEKKEGGEVQM